MKGCNHGNRDIKKKLYKKKYTNRGSSSTNN